MLEGGALQLELRRDQGDRVDPYVARFDFEQDGTVRDRVWSLEGTERTRVLDLHHHRLEPQDD